jgi:hypothetical protein
MIGMIRRLSREESEVGVWVSGVVLWRPEGLRVIPECALESGALSLIWPTPTQIGKTPVTGDTTGRRASPLSNCQAQQQSRNPQGGEELDGNRNVMQFQGVKGFCPTSYAQHRGFLAERAREMSFD